MKNEIVFVKDWAHPTSCKLVPYQTAFSALGTMQLVLLVERSTPGSLTKNESYLKNKTIY